MDKPGGKNILLTTTSTETPLSINFVGNGDRLVFDPNTLQSYITLQAAEKNAAVPNEPQKNNNVTCEQDYLRKATHTQHPRSASEESIVMEVKTTPKKPCPLEMSIKAANLDAEFENDSYVILNGGRGNDGSTSISPYTTMIRCDGQNGVSPVFMGRPLHPVPVSGAAPPNVPSFTADEPFELTIQSTPNNSEPLRVLLVQVQPQVQETSRQNVMMGGVPPLVAISRSTDVVSTSSTSVFSTVTGSVPNVPLMFSTATAVRGAETIAPLGLSPSRISAVSHCQSILKSPSYLSPTQSIIVAPTQAIQPSTTASSSSTEPTGVSNVKPADSPARDVYTVPNSKSLAISTAARSEKSHKNFRKTEITRDQSQASESDAELTRESMICEVDASDDSSSMDEESEEESLVLKIRKVPPKPRKRKSDSAESDSHGRRGPERWERVKSAPKKKKSGKSHDNGDWSASDDESLAKIVQRKWEENEYETNPKFFRRAPKCCIRLCHVKLQPTSQELAFRMFLELEERGQGDRYLASCIQLVKSESATKNSDLTCPLEVEQPPSPWPSFGDDDDDVSVDIANESKGNQSLSDEIQNAIKESLKDQETISAPKEDSKPAAQEDQVVAPKGPVTDEFKYFLVIKNRLRMVCLKFLLAVLRIPMSRIELLQNKMINGEVLDRIAVTVRQRQSSAIWVAARRHLDALPSHPIPFCKTTPPHRYLEEPINRHTLFDRFREFHFKEHAKEVTIKFETYRRFIQTSTNFAFRRMNDSCAGCDSQIVAKMNGRKGRNETAAVGDTNTSLKSRKSKVKTKNSLKNGEMGEKRKKSKKMGHAGGKKGGGPRKGQRGDVFSLMLTHLKTVPCRVPQGCSAPQQHKFFSPAVVTVQMLYDDYRKFFLKETNSELGLRYAIYESLFLRNSYFSIEDLDPQQESCPKCDALPLPGPKSTLDKKHSDGKKKVKTALNR